MIIGEGPRSTRTGIPGWHTNQEEDFYVDKASNVPDEGVIVIVGGEYGRDASEMLWATKGRGVRVYVVDLFPADHHMGNLLDIFKGNLAHVGLTEYLTVIQGYSDTVGKSWDGGPIDLLHIDAGHTYEDVRGDIKAWSRHVADGGLITFHDYAWADDAHPLHFEVKRAVDENYGGRVQRGPDSVAYVVQVVVRASKAPSLDSLGVADYTTIKGVGEARAKKLRAMGFKTFADLASADADYIATAEPNWSIDQIRSWISGAKVNILDD